MLKQSFHSPYLLAAARVAEVCLNQFSTGSNVVYPGFPQVQVQTFPVNPPEYFAGGSILPPFGHQLQVPMCLAPPMTPNPFVTNMLLEACTANSGSVPVGGKCIESKTTAKRRKTANGTAGARLDTTMTANVMLEAARPKKKTKTVMAKAKARPAVARRKNGRTRDKREAQTENPKPWRRIVRVWHKNLSLDEQALELAKEQVDELARLQNDPAYDRPANGVKYKSQGKKHSSVYRGVYYNKSSNSWRCRIYFDGKDGGPKRSMHIGNFDTELEAALRYDDRAMELGRECLNFPQRRDALIKAGKLKWVCTE